MDEYKLTIQDYRDIFNLAHNEWLSNKDKDEQLILCKIYVKCFKNWLKSKNMSIIDGKIING